MERAFKLGVRVFWALLVCVQALVLDACAFRGRESVTYYQGNFPTYKQGSDGRYYPVDKDGSFMPLDYGYRPDLKGYSVIVPQGQQAQQGQVPPGAQQPMQVRPGQLVPAGQPYVVMPQQGAPGAAVPPRVDPSAAYSQQQAAAGAAAGVAYAAPAPIYGQQPPYTANPYAQVNPYAPGQGAPPVYQGGRRPVLPTGYDGDNDEGYSIAVTPEQVDNEAKERAAAAPIMPKASQVAKPAASTPSRLPDLNKIYSNTVEDADNAYQIPSGYSKSNVDDYNTYYNY